LYESLIAILRAQGFTNAFAGIALPNEASVRLHEGMGFIHVGIFRNVGYKCGRWHDVGWWQYVMQEAVQNPNEPIAIGSGDADWEACLASGSRNHRKHEATD
jgi:phosphinothricin acetyltransferase